MSEIKWVLGSGSPRRKELLTGLGFKFTVRTKDTDETYDVKIPLENVPVFLAEKKANALLPSLLLNEILICADTVVILENEILGKPANYEEACRMLRKQAGKVQTVITGVFIGNKNKSECFSEKTLVHFDEMTDEEIAYYVGQYEPYDKAGSYGVQEWMGFAKVSKIDGTYSNVMGLPTNLLYKVIKERFSNLDF